MKEYVAIEIETLESVKLLRMVEPPYRELDVDVLQNCFIILDYPIEGNATVVEAQHLKKLGIEKLIAAYPIKVWKAIVP